MKHSVLGWETMSKNRTQKKNNKLPIIPLWEPHIKPLPGATCGACGNYIKSPIHLKAADPQVLIQTLVPTWFLLWGLSQFRLATRILSLYSPEM